jgi:hypothetical protein
VEPARGSWVNLFTRFVRHQHLISVDPRGAPTSEVMAGGGGCHREEGGSALSGQHCVAPTCGPAESSLEPGTRWLQSKE